MRVSPPRIVLGTLTLGLALGALAPVARPLALLAQASPGSQNPRVHPELADTTWGRRTHAAWELAYKHDWAGARNAFEALRKEQPDAIEPRLGLAFVARGSGDYPQARRWYRSAIDADPSSTDARQQLAVAEWDRPAELAATAGQTTASGNTTADASIGLVLPIDPQFTVTARAGALGGGDPVHGILLTPGNGKSVSATVVSGGLVVRPTARTAVSARYDRWSASGTSESYLFLDGGVRATDALTLRVSLRPVSGNTSAPQFGGGVDLLVAPGNLVTLEASQGTRAAPFEARSQVRAFYQLTPSVRGSVRLGLVRDIDPALSATTGVASGTYYFVPRFGVRAEALTRGGAFARNSVALGVVTRW